MRADPVYLERTGDARLRLDGPSLAASDSSHTIDGPGQNRWHEIDVWEAVSLGLGQYAVAISYHSNWRGELSHHAVWYAAREDVRDVLRDYDPVAHLVGYPPGEAYAGKQAALTRDILDRWEHMVSRMLKAMEVLDLPTPADPGAAS